MITEELDQPDMGKKLRSFQRRRCWCHVELWLRQNFFSSLALVLLLIWIRCSNLVVVLLFLVSSVMLQLKKDVVVILIPFSSVFLCRRICQWGKTCRTISQQPLDRSCLTPLLDSTHSLYSAPTHIYRLASLCNRTAWCHCVCRLTVVMTDSNSYPVPC